MTLENRDTQLARIRANLPTYFDGELQDECAREEVERELASNPELAEEMKALEALRHRLREVPEPSAPSYLRDRVVSAMNEATQDVVVVPVSIWRPRNPMLGWAVAAVLMVALGLNLLPEKASDIGAGIGADDGLGVFVADHVALVQADCPGIQSDDPREMEAWFRERLDYQPSLPEWAWADPISGKVSYLQGKRAARVHYELSNNEKISLFVHPASPERKMEAAGATSPDKAIIQEIKGYKVACWGERGLEYVLVAEAKDESVLEYLKSPA